jgi:hypothetical protein
VSLFIVVGVTGTTRGFSIYKLIIFRRLPPYLVHVLAVLTGAATAIMEPEASSNASQIVGSNTDNLYSVIDKDK